MFEDDAALLTEVEFRTNDSCRKDMNLGRINRSILFSTYCKIIVSVWRLLRS